MPRREAEPPAGSEPSREEATGPTSADPQVSLREQFAKLAESVPGVICSFRLRPDGTASMPFATPAAEELYGVSREELARDMSAWARNVHPDDLPGVVRRIAASARTLSRWHDVFRYQHPTRGLRWIEGWSSPQPESGEGVIWHGYVTDVTAHKQLQEHLRESERKLREVIRASGAAYFEHSADLSSGFATPRMAEILGFAPEALPVCPALVPWLMERLHPEDAPGFVSAMAEYATGKAAELERELRVRGREGWRWVRLVITAVTRSGHRPDRSAGLVFDITERMDAEARLLADRSALERLHEVSARLVSEDALPTLLEAVMDAALAVAGARMGTLHILEEGSSALRLVAQRGFPPDVVRSLAEVPDDPVACPERLRGKERHVVEDARACPHLAGTQAQRLLEDAGVRALQSTPLIARDGRPLGMISTHWREPHRPDDVTLRMLDLLARQAADLIEHRRREQALRDADRRKTDFLAVLSHELRNPLAPIRNAVYLLHHAPPGGPQAERARAVIERQADHLAKLVDDLLDLSRVNFGKIALQRTVLDAREVVRRTCDDLRPLFDERGPALHLDLDDQPVWVDADPTRLAQIAGNLLTNAAKFTPPGGRVAVTVRAEGGSCVLRVRDTGVGIDPGLLEAIFEPFAQAERTRWTARGGMGIGLSLVRSLVGMHGGTVVARSEGAGRGAELVVTLPLAPQHAGVAGRAPTPAVPRLDLVLVEDEADGRETLGEILRMQGHEVRLAADGRQGIEAVRERLPDALICDVGLPDLNGYEVVARVRAVPGGAATYAVALTGYAQPDDVQRARDAGFDAHLAKPPDLDQLERLLAEAAARRARRAPAVEPVPPP
ncbi:multi-sensor hybrid histidine kinase [Anaeromyxobacter sp. K]|uniref:hybrid sensor histidine kinase/response regulator n=1 Tax=Anaeromyxobacter sp. (strain K) TaxID=447217 RepID=UPI00015F8B05|nr:ATP-binding protein [Anaeromyxobacter sp. K]ACG72914.1 multi-sensor hybrid histidine kinase [Anaeromyxobacter sp. K]